MGAGTHGRRHAGRARRRGRGGRRRGHGECLAAEAPAVQASTGTLLAQDEGESAIQYAPQSSASACSTTTSARLSTRRSTARYVEYDLR